MLAIVRRTVHARRLLGRGDHVIAACSGGPDSVAMTHALVRLARELGITVAVASVDHGLRAEAAAEVAGVARLAGGLGVPFYGLRAELAGSGSLQGRARDARYRALLELARDRGARRVAVGHTMDDQAETVLGRVLRGAGLDGVSGIAPRRRDGVIRPLIDCRRSDVERYLADQGLSFVTDPSNADRRFERARLRAEVMPVLRAEDPQLVPHLARLADDARAASRLARARAEAFLAQHGFPAGDPPASRLRRAPAAVRRAALRIWARARTNHAPRRAHVDALEKLLEPAGEGEVLLGGEWGASVVEDRLIVRRQVGRFTRSTRKHD